MKQVTMVDYGVGNVFSAQRAIEYCGASVTLTSNPTEILNADRLVLPGVGAFGAGMKALRDRNLIDSILGFAEKNKPFLGICLGMQMLLRTGLEFGTHDGLGLINGVVDRICGKDDSGAQLRVPQIGWNCIQPSFEGAWKNGIFRDLPEDKSFVYFVHSFVAIPEDPNDVSAYCRYGDQQLVAAIQKGNVFGCQFHPERSGEVGLKIIKNFIDL